MRPTLIFCLLAACAAPAQRSMEGSGSGDNFVVYAHSDHVLYTIDLSAKTLVTVGNFNAPNNDVITDLAVAPEMSTWQIAPM